MLSALGRFFWRVFGPRKLEVVEDLPHRVSLGFGPTRTVFDRDSEKVTKDGKIVAMIPLITGIHVYHPNAASSNIWRVSATVEGRRSVELGHAYSREEALHIAGVLSMLVKRPIKAER
jgi:hypothetical protein